jgi:hypothetical protein
MPRDSQFASLLVRVLQFKLLRTIDAVRSSQEQARVPRFLNQGAGQRRTTGLGYDDIKGQQLGQCLKSLESRPQWWTSYSNNRQNAVVMCQAARGQIEKGELSGRQVRVSIARAKTCLDEMLDLQRSMAGVNSEMSSVLLKTIDSAHFQLRAQAKYRSRQDAPNTATA